MAKYSGIHPSICRRSNSLWVRPLPVRVLEEISQPNKTERHWIQTALTTRAPDDIIPHSLQPNAIYDLRQLKHLPNKSNWCLMMMNKRKHDTRRCEIHMFTGRNISFLVSVQVFIYRSLAIDDCFLPPGFSSSRRKTGFYLCDGYK